MQARPRTIRNTRSVSFVLVFFCANQKMILQGAAVSKKEKKMDYKSLGKKLTVLVEQRTSVS